MDGFDTPSLRTAVPGPGSEALVDVLARRECPAITARRSRRAARLGVSDADPIVWEQAVGANVWDADGNRFVDLTSGFGVALMGHRAPAVVQAVRAQCDRLLHAMGDTFPDIARIQLLDELLAIAPEGMEHAILGLSGSDAVDGMVKTAVLATGRTGVLVFGGGYHGLSLGTVPLQRYKDGFSAPFQRITHPDVHALPWGSPPSAIEPLLASSSIGLVLAEPIQGRGGMRPAPDGWLAEITALAHRHGALVGFDEIQCGMGRTGTPWAADVAPDLMAVGKALGGGFPLSACIGTAEAMEAWGASTGEALHTQTFLGHPVGCAAARAVIRALPTTLQQVQQTAARVRQQLEQRDWEYRGRGLMIGIHHPDALGAMRSLLAMGYITLPAGASAEVIGFTPPAVLSEAQISGFFDALETTR